MGRARMKMERISKEKSRNTTLKKRKEGLIRKLHEFTTLCDVDACMIIYGGDEGSSSPPAAEIWPENHPEQVTRLVDILRSSKKVKGYGLRNFFDDRRRKVEVDVAKLRRRNLDAKYPTNPELLLAATEPQLRDFHALLVARVHEVRSRLSIQRNIPTPAAPAPACYSLVEANPTNIPMNIPMDVNNNHSMSNLQAVTMLLMNNSSNEQLLRRQIFVQEPIIPQPWCYAPPPPPQQYYMLPPPPMQLQYDDFIHYRPTNYHDLLD